MRGLGDGTLDREAFAWYLAQDALYLRDYARVLAEASRIAPTGDEQAFWAESAHEAVAAEIQLHQSWIPADTLDRLQPSPTTTAYLNHLLAVSTRGDYRALIAALLPCFWLYEDIGARLRPLSHPEHPYRSWIDSYADAGFAESSRRAVSIVAAAASATAAERTAMQTAFRTSAAHELAFFAAPTGRADNRGTPGVPRTDESEAPETQTPRPKPGLMCATRDSNPQPSDP
ncbi:TenA family protein [Leifsonia xyli]|uniref:TenA family protein n=1 Tax=Leifsonia xyli TaxID=1575 RepID=UPI001CB866E4